MKLNQVLFFEFMVAFAFLFFSVVLYYNVNDIQNDSLGIATLDCLARAFIMVFVLERIKKSCNGNSYTGATFLLYSTVIYNSISAIKYSVTSFYPGAIDNTLIRIIGSFYVDLIIIFGVLTFEKFHNTYINKLSLQDTNIKLHVPVYTSFLLVVLYSCVNIYSVITKGNVLVEEVSRTLATFVNLLTYLTYASAILSIKKTSTGKINYLSALPIIALIVVNLYFTMATGKKNLIMVVGLVIALGTLLNGLITFKSLKYIAYCSPFFFQILQAVSELTSKRDFFDTQYKLIYHAFRFDLSDLAVTISLNYSKLSGTFDVFVEALNIIIPSILYPDKNTELIAYMNQMEEIGMIRDFDYNDTFFSMGAQIGGFVGMAVVFMAIIIFFEWISIKILNIKKIGLSIMIVLVSYFATCESDWSMFLSQTRDMILITFFAYWIFKVIIKKRSIRK